MSHIEYDNIKRLIQQDATSLHGIENLNIDTFIKDLDPDIWKAVCMLTEPLSSKAKKGTDHSNTVRKIRRFFSTCVLFFGTKTEEERRARLENVAATKRLNLAMEMDKERKSRLEKMVATAQLMLALTKGVVNVGVVLSLNPF